MRRRVFPFNKGMLHVSRKGGRGFANFQDRQRPAYVVNKERRSKWQYYDHHSVAPYQHYQQDPTQWNRTSREKSMKSQSNQFPQELHSLTRRMKRIEEEAARDQDEQEEMEEKYFKNLFYTTSADDNAEKGEGSLEDLHANVRGLLDKKLQFGMPKFIQATFVAQEESMNLYLSEMIAILQDSWRSLKSGQKAFWSQGIVALWLSSMPIHHQSINALIQKEQLFVELRQSIWKEIFQQEDAKLLGIVTDLSFTAKFCFLHLCCISISQNGVHDIKSRKKALSVLFPRLQQQMEMNVHPCSIVDLLVWGELFQVCQQNDDVLSTSQKELLSMMALPYFTQLEVLFSKACGQQKKAVKLLVQYREGNVFREPSDMASWKKWMSGGEEKMKKASSHVKEEEANDAEISPVISEAEVAIYTQCVFNVVRFFAQEQTSDASVPRRYQLDRVSRLVEKWLDFCNTIPNSHLPLEESLRLFAALYVTDSEESYDEIHLLPLFARVPADVLCRVMRRQLPTLSCGSDEQKLLYVQILCSMSDDVTNVKDDTEKESKAKHRFDSMRNSAIQAVLAAGLGLTEEKQSSRSKNTKGTQDGNEDMKMMQLVRWLTFGSYEGRVPLKWWGQMMRQALQAFRHCPQRCPGEAANIEEIKLIAQLLVMRVRAKQASIDLTTMPPESPQPRVETPLTSMDVAYLKEALSIVARRMSNEGEALGNLMSFFLAQGFITQDQVVAWGDDFEKLLDDYKTEVNSGD